MSEAPGFDPNSPENRQQIQISDELWQATTSYIDTIPVASADFLRSDLAARMITKHAQEQNPDISDQELEDLAAQIQSEGSAEAIIEHLQDQGRLAKSAKEGVGFIVKRNTPAAVAKRHEQSKGGLERTRDRVDRALGTKFGKKILKPIVQQTGQNITYRRKQASTVGQVADKSAAALGRGTKKVTGVSAVERRLNARDKRNGKPTSMSYREEAEHMDWESSRQFDPVIPSETSTTETASSQGGEMQTERLASLSDEQVLAIDSDMGAASIGYLLTEGKDLSNEQKLAGLANLRREIAGFVLGPDVTDHTIEALIQRANAISLQRGYAKANNPLHTDLDLDLDDEDDLDSDVGVLSPQEQADYDSAEIERRIAELEASKPAGSSLHSRLERARIDAWIEALRDQEGSSSEPEIRATSETRAERAARLRRERGQA